MGEVIDYYYSVDCDGQPKRHEWLVDAHRLEMASEKGINYIIYDHWIDIPEDSYLYSSAFTDCVARHTVVKSPVKPFTTTVRLKVRAPQLRQEERLALRNCVRKSVWHSSVPIKPLAAGRFSRPSPCRSITIMNGC